jgi:trk system potassium uptake protein TrkA
MVKRRQVAVLGLGRFGSAVARELTRLGHEVLAIDSDERTVQGLAEEVTNAVQADVTDEEALRELGVGDFDTVIIGVSSSLEVSILATVSVQQLGVKRILAKARNAQHGLILERVGATRAIYPEHETGTRLAHSFASPGVRDYLDVAPGYGFARVGAPDVWVNHKIGELETRRTCGLTLMALRRGGTVTLNPHHSEILQVGDELIMAGLDEDLERLPSSDASAPHQGRAGMLRLGRG